MDGKSSFCVVHSGGDTVEDDVGREFAIGVTVKGRDDRFTCCLALESFALAAAKWFVFLCGARCCPGSSSAFVTFLTPSAAAARVEEERLEAAVCPSFVGDFLPALFPLLSLRFFASAAMFALAVLNMPASVLGRLEEDEETGGCC